MKTKHFKPEHINAIHEDFLGNDHIGRYLFFPGSDGRAKQIAEHFSNVEVKESQRGLNLYKGELIDGDNKIDVAAISSGMGTPSLDIVLNELIKLGARRFLRVGTSGLLQPAYMNSGDFVIATASVRDEGASRSYVPLEYPAVASIEYVLAAQAASRKLGFENQTHTGIIHSKDSLFAREFEEGPLAQQNHEYMEILRRAGVIASEMEASLLFVLANIFTHELNLEKGYSDTVKSIKAGAVCAVLGEGSDFGSKEALNKMTQNMIELAKQTIVELSNMENKIT